MSDSLTTPRERRRAQTTAEILDAAWRLARRDGLTAISMRELGREVGLRAQSLYAYVESKSALYDAMFRQGQEQLIAASAEWPTDLGTVADPRAAAKRIAREWAEFCAADPVRYQLMFQRVIPDWEPSPETYALAVDRVDDLRRALAGVGIVGEEAVDLFTAVVTGITAQQLSNDPGGDRWLRLIDTAVDMFFDHLRLDEPDRSPGGTP